MNEQQKETGPLLVLVDHVPADEGRAVLSEASRRLLTMAQQLQPGNVWAIALSADPDLEGLGQLGASGVYVPELEGLSPRIPAVVADAALACVRACPHQPLALLCVSTSRGRDVAAQVATSLHSGASAEVSSLQLEGERLLASKDVLGGTWETQFQITRGIPVIALRTTALKAVVSPVGEPVQRVDVSVDFRPSSRQVSVVSSRRTQQQGPALAEAPVVVCGGRGTNGDFAPVRRLAQRLGGAVGATRVATEEGWIDRAAQVGQSGESIAPLLYIGLGISGDVHHVSGIRGARTIVAVCDDPDAAIFPLADLGIVGDLKQVVEQALEELGD